MLAGSAMIYLVSTGFCSWAHRPSLCSHLEHGCILCPAMAQLESQVFYFVVLLLKVLPLSPSEPRISRMTCLRSASGARFS